MSARGTFEGFKVTGSGRIASRVSFPRADYHHAVAALPEGWRLIGGKRADPATQYFVGNRLVPRPRIVANDNIELVVGAEFIFQAPGGTELIELRSKNLIPIVDGKLTITADKLGVKRYSLAPPSPYKRQTLVVTVTD